MIEQLVPERNWWERVYTKEDIYEFHKYEKGVQRTEAEKFSNIAQATMIELKNNIFTEVSQANYNIPTNIKSYFQPFVEKITSVRAITSKPFNPKVMAFTFLYLQNINQKIFYSRNAALECFKMIQAIENKIKNNLRLNAFETQIRDFMKDTGMNSENLVRYFVFYKNTFKEINL